MSTQNDVAAACRVLEERMQLEAEAERQHEVEETKHRLMKEGARAKAQQLRGIILDLDPAYRFALNVRIKDITPDDTEVSSTDDEVSEHQRNYGKWAKVAKDVLRLNKGKGTFGELCDVAKRHGLVDPASSSKDLLGLRGALYGLVRRKGLDFVPGVGNAPGIFKEKTPAATPEEVAAQ